jgi:glycosyltransferase involved in cell wall biosynthesis
MLVGLARAGHAIRSLAPITPETARAGDDFAARHPELGVTRFSVPYFETSPHTPAAEEYRRLEQDQVERQLSVLIERERPDVLLLGRETFAWRVPEVARRYGLPCILRIAGGFLAGIVDGTYPALLVAHWLEQVRKVDFVVAQTASVEANLAALGVERIRIVPNGVNLQLFAPGPGDATLRRELDIADDRVVIVHASNLKPLKRALDIVESAVRALEVNPRLLYLIVGDGVQRRAMEEACARQGITEHFRFIGWVPYERVPAYLKLADLVLMPSESEAQARVYLEAQACARTLLASDVAGARHVIDDGQTGLLFRRGDVQDLTTKTLSAAADPGLRARIGGQARQRVMTHSLDRIAAAYTALIEEALLGRARRRVPGDPPRAQPGGGPAPFRAGGRG